MKEFRIIFLRPNVIDDTIRESAFKFGLLFEIENVHELQMTVCYES